MQNIIEMVMILSNIYRACIVIIKKERYFQFTLYYSYYHLNPVKNKWNLMTDILLQQYKLFLLSIMIFYFYIFFNENCILAIV